MEWQWLEYFENGYLREMDEAGRIWETFPALTACLTRPPAALPAAPNIVTGRVRLAWDGGHYTRHTAPIVT